RGVGAAYTRVVFRYDPLATPQVAKPAYVTDPDATTIPFVVTGLEPDTTYNFAMETYYDPDGPGVAAPFYVRPSIMRTCTTSKPEVVHEGWDHIFAVGNKTDGLNGDAVIKESFAPETINKFNYFMTGNGTDLEPLDRYHLIEDPAAPASAGLVHLSWFDFKFSSLGTYANSVADGSNLYYVVERSPNPDMSGAIDIGAPIAVQNGIYLYHFVDNQVPAAGVKYYYRVKLRMDLVDLLFSSFDPTEAAINNTNAILEVMIPPPNMAFIHRYMFNKHQCMRINDKIWHGRHTYPDVGPGAPNRALNYDIMSGHNMRGARGGLYQDVSPKNYDITNNYRCLYNGIGSTYDSIADDYFFDIGRSFMVDRFEVGFKIGLVGTNPCDQSGAYGGPMNCISESTNGRGVADKDTIWMRVADYHGSDA
ncbi:MAG: hypothetical protein EBR93_06085, partial [Bacteroidetes bacterium]|nr:hypothetical protein [Bacteroidota bacterium]